MVSKKMTFNGIRYYLIIVLSFVVINNFCVYASDNAGYRKILTITKTDIKNQKLIVPGQSVGFLNIGKPIPYSFIEFYGAPDSYSEPAETKDSGALSW